MAENGKNERGGPLGGQELPPEVQDRPEQNRGYDEAVEGGSGRTVEMQAAPESIVERRRDAEDAADRPDEGRGAPAPDKAEGERMGD
ncbi:MAG: hypothetical protein M3Q55_14335 [Acidobacteriota bacterium]|nr:hypothetical protein [Acidobacteriota bacterium]